MRHDADSIIDERAAREIYLPAFEAAVKQAHVGAVMDSYNLVNGQHTTQNAHFNVDILRKEWGFEGVVMSDWRATYDGPAAANGGLDLEMPTSIAMSAEHLMPAINSGTVKVATIDNKARHILSTALSFGWLDSPQKDTAISVVDKQNDEIAMRSAQESIVLLKNSQGLLPLDRTKIKTIAVIGPDAYPAVPVGGGSAGVVPFEPTDVLRGMLLESGPGVTVFFDPGLPAISDLINRTTFTTEASGGQAGIKLLTFANDRLEGTPSRTTVVAHAVVPSSGPDVTDSNRLVGYYKVARPGKYIVILQAEHGESLSNRVFVDDKLVLDHWNIALAKLQHVLLDLHAGEHKVLIEQRQTHSGNGGLSVAIVAQQDVVNERAKELAKSSDVVLLAAGYASENEGEGGDRPFSLPWGQEELIQEVSSRNKKTIVSITSGGGFDAASWIDQVPALLETWYGGQDGGRALAEVVFGKVNPSGHLPITFERKEADNPTYNNYYPHDASNRVEYKEGIFVGYRGYEQNHIKPLFPFGYGLSYSTFSFDHLDVQKTQVGGSLKVQVSFDVTNTGITPGAEVAQLYVTEDHPEVPRPMHELKGFERVFLQPGETRHVTVPLDARSFSYFDVHAEQWKIGTNQFTISVGDSVASLPLKTDIHLNIPLH